MRLQGKTALITGGGTGIGKAIAHLFAREGARIVIAGRREQKLVDVLAEIHSELPDAPVLAVPADVSVESDAHTLVNATVSQFGGVDILVNNAATILSRSPLKDTPPELWDATMDVNVKGVYLCCREVLPHMVKAQKGAIVNIASVSGQRGQPSNAAYSTSKGAVINLTRSLAVDYGPQGIRCNSVSPGLVRTEMAETRLKPGETWEARAEKEWLPNYPLRRIGAPEDIAYGTLFLASDEASWISGIDLRIDGGKLAKL